MDFELSEEHRMLKDLVARFVKDELLPLEAGVLEREASGKLGKAVRYQVASNGREVSLLAIPLA